MPDDNTMVEVPVKKPAMYHLGCPAWSIPQWRGGFFPEKLRTADFLSQYSMTFNTVEGNSFFYALPGLDVVDRWAALAAEGFEFCFKAPRAISHARRLPATSAVYDYLLDCLDRVARVGKLGPTFLQLHASFSPERLPELEKFCRDWPERFPLAVEVRHMDFFTVTPCGQALNQLLESYRADRVIFDSRALFHSPPDDPAEKHSQGRKPRLPVLWDTTGQRPMVRFVGRNRIELAQRWQIEVAEKVATWIGEGKHPYVFMHTPDDALAPYLCRQFHRLLQERVSGLSNLSFPENQEQMELF